MTSGQNVQTPGYNTYRMFAGPVPLRVTKESRSSTYSQRMRMAIR